MTTMARTAHQLEVLAMHEIFNNIDQLSLLQQNMLSLVPEDIAAQGLEGFREVLTTIAVNHNMFLTKLRNFLMPSNKILLTEYTTWYAKNVGLVAKVEKMDYASVKDLPIDIPTGMEGTYPNTITLINRIMDELNILPVVSGISKTINSMMIAISQGSDKCEAFLKMDIIRLNNLKRKVEPFCTKLETLFTTDNPAHMEKKLFGAQFTSIDELQKCRLEIATINKSISLLNTLTNKLPNMEKEVTECVNYVVASDTAEEGEYKPSEQFVKQFAEYLYTAEYLLHNYGVAVTKYLAIVHNLTFVYGSLGKA